jgi:hypothetical protein
MVIGLTTPNTHPTAFDPAAFITQQIMAISGIVLLLLGSRITHFYHRYRLREMGERDAIHLARSSQLASEMELRERALHLRKLGDGIDTSLVELAEWLRPRDITQWPTAFCIPRMYIRGSFANRQAWSIPRAWSILALRGPAGGWHP